MHNGQHRVVPTQHRRGLDFTAPFWHGATAQRIVSKRLKAYVAAKEAKRVARSSRPGGSAVRLTTAATLVPKQLRRLERALQRRKTLAARQRIAARIKVLKAELGL